MRLFLPLFIISTLMSCDRSKSSPIVQTATEVRIDTPQFHIVIPGQWKEEQVEQKNLLYSAMNPGRTRHVTISGYLLQAGLTPDARRQAFQRLLDVSINVESEMTKGKIHSVGITDAEEFLVADYFVTDEQHARVAFCHLICDHEKALRIYWEALQLYSMPDLPALLKEFQTISNSVELKQTEKK